MALLRSTRPAPINVRKRIGISEFFRNTKRKKVGIFLLIGVALIGGYFVFKSFANPNNCVTVEGGAICDVDQASNYDDSVLNTNEEPFNLGQNQKWAYWGTAFKVPNFAQNGAQPLTRIFYAPLTIHGAYLPGEELNNLLANGAIAERTLGYAWPTQSQPGTVAIHRYERALPFAQTLYTADKAQGDHWVAADPTWQYKGIGFYAYPPTYTPAPLLADAPDTVDKPVIISCPEQSHTKGDNSECVKKLKTIMIGIGFSDGVDKNNSVFDEKLDNLVRFANKALRDQGKTQEIYDKTVTPEIWRSLQKALDDRLNPPQDSTLKCPQDLGRALTAAEQEAGWNEYLSIVQTKGADKLTKNCHALWLAYNQAKNQPKLLPVVTPTQPSNPAVPAPAYDACPGTKSGQDAGWQEYQQGRLTGKNYDPVKCSQLWDAYGKLKNDQTPPGTPSTQNIDTNCETAKLQPFSKGKCVSLLKFRVFYIGWDSNEAALELNTPTFNTELNNALRSAVDAGGVPEMPSGSYRNYVTSTMWKTIEQKVVERQRRDNDALRNAARQNPGGSTGTPAAPTAPSAPAPAPSTPNVDQIARLTNLARLESIIKEGDLVQIYKYSPRSIRVTFAANRGMTDNAIILNDSNFDSRRFKIDCSLLIYNSVVDTTKTYWTYQYGYTNKIGQCFHYKPIDYNTDEWRKETITDIGLRGKTVHNTLRRFYLNRVNLSPSNVALQNF